MYVLSGVLASNCLSYKCLISFLQELGAEKSKMASLEARLKAELAARGQEVDALRANMQTADQEHLKQTQQLNHKVCFSL